MADPLSQLVDRQLSSVEFVHDYVQLRFDGPALTVLSPIGVRTGSAVVRSGEDQFRNALCGQIAKVVRDVALLPEEELTVQFADGSRIEISLRAVDYTGPEAVTCCGLDGTALMVI